jgi:PAS domain S-box-containing protein
VTASPQDCHAALRAIADDYPQFTSIGFVDAKGMITCFSLPAETQPLRDVDVFRNAMAADPSAFVVGTFLIGPITGKPIVDVAAPLFSSVGGERPSGIVYASLDLDRAAQHAWDFAGPTDAILSLIDTRAATILVRSDQRKLAGKTLEGSPIIAEMRAHPNGGNLEAIDADGTLRIFGYAPLNTGEGSGIMVAVGLSRAAVTEDADRRFMIGIAAAVFTATMAAGAAWIFADRTQFRAIRSLVETATRLGSGDLAARANLPAWQAAEFRTLDKTLCQMADSIAVAHKDLAASERQLRLLAENSTDMILIVSGDGQRLYASPACRPLLGWEPEEMLRISTMDAIHPDDLGFLKDRFAYNVGEPATYKYRMRRKDGSYVWVEAVSRSLPTEAGRLKQRLVVARDIDRRVAAEQRLKESETRYRLLAEYATDMVFQLDIDQVRNYVSPACREILGYEPEEMIGVRPVDMVHPDDRERVAGVFQSVLDGITERTSVVNRIGHRNGTWIWVEAQLRALKDPESGAPTGIIGALRDVSDRELQAEASKAAKEAAETASQAKSDFLASMSHEIRTPLCGILGFTEILLEDDTLRHNHRRQIQLIQVAGSSLLTIVDDILDFSRIEAGHVQLEPRTFALRPFIDDTITIVRPLAEKKGLQLLINVEPSVPQYLVGDTDRLRQVLLNLLNNAIKFTATGSITMGVNGIGEDHDSAKLVFAVRDTGIGIPPNKLSTLFHRFSQVEGSVRREFGGTGLGLAISKTLVELMGGTIGVKSAAAAGTSFWFEVALPKADPSQISYQRTADAHVSSPRPARILLVEDLGTNQEISRTILGRAGHHVDVVDNGAEALAAVQKNAYDLIFMDIHMPAMDGLTATRLIRSLDHPASTTPIVAMTANVLPSQLVAFRNAGMNDHVGKPFNRAALMRAVNMWTALPSNLPIEQNVQTTGSTEAVDQHAYREACDLLGIERARNALMRLGEEIATCLSHEQLTTGNPEHLAKKAHALISAAGLLGFFNLSRTCTALELACLNGEISNEMRSDVIAARCDALDALEMLLFNGSAMP